MSHAFLVDLWYTLTAALLFLHLGLGGIDLGVCVLSLFLAEEEAERVLTSIDGIWHANQTWLVVLGAVLFGAFPGVYADVLPRVYGLVIFLLAALGVRGLGIEYRHESTDKKRWQRLAGWGAVAVLLAEGLILARLLAPILNRTADLSLLHIVQTSLLPILFFLSSCVLLTCGAWLQRSMSVFGAPSLRLQSMAVWSVLAGAAGTLLLAAVLCRKLTASVPSPQYILLPLAVSGGVVLPVLLASIRKSWKGSSLPWALILVGISLAACAVCLYPSAQTRNMMMSLAASSDALSFLIGAAALLLPPLLVFQIFQYRLQHQRTDPAATFLNSAGRG